MDETRILHVQNKRDIKATSKYELKIIEHFLESVITAQRVIWSFSIVSTDNRVLKNRFGDRLALNIDDPPIRGPKLPIQNESKTYFQQQKNPKTHLSQLISAKFLHREYFRFKMVILEICVMIFSVNITSLNNNIPVDLRFFCC